MPSPLHHALTPQSSSAHGSRGHRGGGLAVQGLINDRNKKLEVLVNAAAGPAVQQPHNRRTPLERIDLREEACRADAATLANGPALDALPDITEDGAEGAPLAPAASPAPPVMCFAAAECSNWTQERYPKAGFPE